MPIDFSDDQLKRIIETKPVGDFYPFDMDEYNHEVIDDYISKAVGSLATIRSLKYEAIYDSYGSGYASYVDVFCWKKDGSSSEEREDILWIDGIRIYICRLAPVAVIGKGQVTKHSLGGSRDYIESSTINVFPPGDWDQEITDIRNLLESFFFTVLEPEYLNQPLPFEAKIRTILAHKQYKVFDALFYWED